VSTKLLIVDDEPLTVDMLQTFLQINGYECIGAYNGEDGLVLCQVEQPEIMILDLMLPDIEGFEVCRRLRTSPDYKAFASLPILVLSARAEDGARRRAMDAGANAYMVKPPRFGDLLNELSRLLYEHQYAASETPASAPATEAVATTPAPQPPVPPTPAPQPSVAQPPAATAPQTPAVEPISNQPVKPTMPILPTSVSPNVPANSPTSASTPNTSNASGTTNPPNIPTTPPERNRL